MKLFHHCLVRKISIAPGPLFSPKQRYRNYIRINYAREWDQRMSNAINRLGESIEEQLREIFCSDRDDA